MKQLFLIVSFLLVVAKVYSQNTQAVPQNCNSVISTFKLRQTGVSSSSFFIDLPNSMQNALEFQIVSSSCPIYTGSSYILKNNLSPFRFGLNEAIFVRGTLRRSVSLLPEITSFWGGSQFQKPTYFIIPIQFDLLKL